MRRLTLKEASILADRFDKLGYTEEADMLDEYISAGDDIIKQAGIWDRVKGRVKRIFSKEWRELHDKALKAQSNIEEAIKKMEDLAKELRKDVKNYRINDWGYKIRYVAPKLGFNTSEFAYEFNTAYARYLGHWLKFNDMKNRGIGTEGMDPSEMLAGIPTPVGFGIKRLEQIHDEENNGLWQVVGKEGENPIEIKSSVPTDIRIPNTRFDNMLKQYISIGKFPETNQEGFVIFKPKGKSLPKTVEEYMGGSGAFYVKLQSEDVNYIYLRKIGDVTLEPGTAKITGVKSSEKQEPVLEKALETEEKLLKKEKPKKTETNIEDVKLPSYPNVPDVSEKKQDQPSIVEEKTPALGHLSGNDLYSKIKSEAPHLDNNEVSILASYLDKHFDNLFYKGETRLYRDLKENKLVEKFAEEVYNDISRYKVPTSEELDMRDVQLEQSKKTKEPSVVEQMLGRLVEEEGAKKSPMKSEEVALPEGQGRQVKKPKRHRKDLKERKEKIEELVSKPSAIPLAKEHIKQPQKAKRKKVSQDPKPAPQSVQEEQEEELGMRPPTGEFSVFKAPGDDDADDSFLTRAARVNRIIKLVKG